MGGSWNSRRSIRSTPNTIAWKTCRPSCATTGGIAKAALESDTRVLAFEAGRAWGHRVNVISAGPYASRAASAIGFIDKMLEYCKHNSPLPEAITAEEVGATAAFLCSPLASGITGT